MSPMPSKKKLENFVKEKVRKALKDHGWFSWPVAQGMYSKTGVSDIHAVKLNMYIAIECKRDKTCDPTPLQKEFLKDIAAAGHFAFVVNDETLVEFQAFLNVLDKMIDLGVRGEGLNADDGGVLTECVRVLTEEWHG